MEVTKKVFWNEAVRGGTLMGLVLVGILLLKYAVGLADSLFWQKIVSITYVVVFIAMQYVLTRRIAMMSDPAQGFSWGRCMGFVFAMMLFVGILTGIYHTILYNFMAPGMIEGMMNEVVSKMEAMGMGSMFDDAYSGQMVRMMKNPFYLIFTQIITVCAQGGFAGLFTSIAAKRNPDIFAGGQ